MRLVFSKCTIVDVLKRMFFKIVRLKDYPSQWCCVTALWSFGTWVATMTDGYHIGECGSRT